MSVTEQLTEIHIKLEGVEKDVTYIVKTLDECVGPRLDSHSDDIKSINITLARTRAGVATVVALSASIAGFLGWKG